ncbi:MAG: hypothetical protein AB8H80_11105 [Planctomycetota bacterium]
MAGWGIWAAHRYLTPDAAGPRMVGRDGRLLQRPMGERSERAVIEAQRRRSSRRQSPWPRVLGWLCIGVACMAAALPIQPVPSHVRLSAAARPEPESIRRAIVLPAITVDVPGRSVVLPSQDLGSIRLVVLGGDYREIARFVGMASSPFRLPDALCSQLEPGSTYHAYAISGVAPTERRSAIATFAWR